jgi:hypothetical protein
MLEWKRNLNVSRDGALISRKLRGEEGPNKYEFFR